MMNAEEFVVSQLCIEMAKAERLEKELAFEKAKADNLQEVISTMCEDLELLKSLVIYDSELKMFKFRPLWRTFNADLYCKLCKVMGVDEDYENQIEQEDDIEC